MTNNSIAQYELLPIMVAIDIAKARYEILIVTWQSIANAISRKGRRFNSSS